MKTCFKVLSTATLVALTAISATSCGGGTNYAKDNTKYKIGVSGPLTGSASQYGIGVKNSAQMAVDEINAAGGINGYEVEFTAMDDETKADEAAVNYTSLYEGGMQFSLGCVTSAACLEFAGYAAKNNVFCLTPSATEDDVPATGDNIYQMCFSNSGQGTAAAEYINDNYSDKKIGIFYDSSDSYSRGIYTNFKATYTGTTTDASFTSDSKTSFTSQITSLKDCDFIFMPIYYSEAALFIKQAKDIIKDSAIYYGCDGLDGIDGVSGFEVNDYPQEISYLSHFNASSTREATVTFVNKYKTKFANQLNTLNQFGASAYDCVYAIFNAINGSSLTPTSSPKDCCDYLKSKFNGDYTYSGVTGDSIKWNKDGTVSKEAQKYVVNPDRVGQ